MVKKLIPVICAILLCLSCLPLSAQVSMDISVDEVDKIKGTLRVRDLVVNDSARIGTSGLCSKNGKLYIPDNKVLLDGPIGEWGIDLKITILPGKKNSRSYRVSQYE